MSKELLDALDTLEKEKDISKETLFDAIENSLITACKNHFGKSDHIKVEINRNTCDFRVYAQKTVVEEVEDDVLEISPGRCEGNTQKGRAGRRYSGRYQKQGIWKNCNPKCKKCHSSKDTGGRKKCFI